MRWAFDTVFRNVFSHTVESGTRLFVFTVGGSLYRRTCLGKEEIDGCRSPSRRCSLSWMSEPWGDVTGRTWLVLVACSRSKGWCLPWTPSYSIRICRPWTIASCQVPVRLVLVVHVSSLMKAACFVLTSGDRSACSAYHIPSRVESDIQCHLVVPGSPRKTPLFHATPFDLVPQASRTYLYDARRREKPLESQLLTKAHPECTLSRHKLAGQA